MERGRDGEREGWREGGMERGRDGEKEGWRERGMERGRDGEREGWRERGMEGEMSKWDEDGGMKRETDFDSFLFSFSCTPGSQMSSYCTVLLNNALTLDGLCTHCSTLCPLSLLTNPWNTHSKSALETRAFPHLQYKVLT